MRYELNLLFEVIVLLHEIGVLSVSLSVRMLSFYLFPLNKYPIKNIMKEKKEIYLHKSRSYLII